MTGEALADLLAALSRGIPALPGANCIGSATLFDIADVDEDRQDVEYRFTAAITLCRSCPALAACSAWLEAVPTDDRPGGVVAGRVTRSGLRGINAATLSHRLTGVAVDDETLTALDAINADYEHTILTELDAINAAIR